MGLPLQTLRVLVVDDNVDAAVMLCTLLELSGYQATAAHDGAEALALAQAIRPHVVFLDLSMPGLSGVEVAMALRENGMQPMHLVALSALGDTATRVRTREAGFDAHLQKPATTGDILREIAACTASSRMLHEPSQRQA